MLIRVNYRGFSGQIVFKVAAFDLDTGVKMKISSSHADTMHHAVVTR